MSCTISSILNALSGLRESRIDPLENGKVIFAKKDVDVFSAEGLRTQPDLFGGRFRTSSARSFFAYSSQVLDACGDDEEALGSCAVFIEEFPYGFSPEVSAAGVGGGLRAIAIYDFGGPLSPSWGDHRAEFVPVYTPVMERLIGVALIGEEFRSTRPVRFRQEDFVSFVEDFMELVSPQFYCDGKELHIGDAMEFFKDLTVAKISEHRVAKKRDGVQFKRDASFAEKVLADVPIPDMLSLYDNVYQGFARRKLIFRISFAVDGSFPVVLLEEKASEITRKGLFREFLAECEGLSEKWNVHEGNFTMRARPAFSRQCERRE